jgi:hypothetical protein
MNLFDQLNEGPVTEVDIPVEFNSRDIAGWLWRIGFGWGGFFAFRQPQGKIVLKKEYITGKNEINEARSSYLIKGDFYQLFLMSFKIWLQSTIRQSSLKNSSFALVRKCQRKTRPRTASPLRDSYLGLSTPKISTEKPRISPRLRR